MLTNPADIAAHRLKLRVYTKDDATVLECRGRLTTDVTATLRNQVKSLIPHTKRIVLDLSALTRMDSSGLGTVAGLYVSCRIAGCELRLINLSNQVRELLEMTNLLSMFEACGQYLTKIP